MLPRQNARAVSQPTSDTRPPVRYDIGRQSAGSISNVGRDQYHSYVQHVTQERQSFLREIAATRTKARMFIWIGLALVVGGIGLFMVEGLRVAKQASEATSGTPSQFQSFEMPDIESVLLGFGVGVLGNLLLIVGIVLHVVATARRRRVDRELPVPPTRR
jgi:hypothetical protein